MNETKVFDVTIIGGGPVGLFAAFYSGLRGLSTKIIEASYQLGGQLSLLYPEKYIYDSPGFPKILAKDLVKNLMEQALRFNPTIVLKEQIVELTRESDHYILTSRQGHKHPTKTIIICAGIGSFKPNTLNKPGVKELEGKGVYYFVDDFDEFKNKNVLVVGGGDSAVDWALHLLNIAKSVTLIHRRKGFRAHENSVKQLFESKVNVLLHWEIKELRGNKNVETAVIFNNLTNEERSLSVEAVILSLGFKANIGPIANWGLEITNNLIKTNIRMETNLPGVFAAGDVTFVEGLGNLKLLATGFAQAVVAVGSAKQYLDPSAKLFGGHSSSIVKEQKSPS